MARYRCGFATTVTAVGACLFDIRTTATDRPKVLEIGFFNSAATAGLFSLDRHTTVGAASTTVALQAGDPAEPAATALVGTAHSVAPASTAVPLGRVQLPGIVGAGTIWTFGYGDLVVPVSSGLGLYNRGAAICGVLAGYVVIDE